MEIELRTLDYKTRFSIEVNKCHLVGINKLITSDQTIKTAELISLRAPFVISCPFDTWRSDHKAFGFFASYLPIVTRKVRVCASDSSLS